jgi:hypothetical protein
VEAFRLAGRNTMGVRSMRLAEGQRLAGIHVVAATDEVVLCSTQGLINRVRAAKIPERCAPLAPSPKWFGNRAPSLSCIVHACPLRARSPLACIVRLRTLAVHLPGWKLNRTTGAYDSFDEERMRSCWDSCYARAGAFQRVPCSGSLSRRGSLKQSTPLCCVTSSTCLVSNSFGDVAAGAGLREV